MTAQSTEKRLDPIDQLRIRHPESNRVAICTAANLPKDHRLRSLESVSELMDTAWSASYRSQAGQSKSRFVFTTGYLEWLLANQTDFLNSVLVAMDPDSSSVVGLILLVPRTMEWRGQGFQSGILTGLSVVPSRTGQGIGQLLHFAGKKCLFEKSRGQPIFMWWDSASGGREKAMRTFLRRDQNVTIAGRHAMLYHILDYEAAARVLDLRWYEKAFLAAFAQRKKGGRETPLPEIELMTDETAEEFLDSKLIGTNDDRVLRRTFIKESFIQQANFVPSTPGDPFRPLNFVLRHQGDLAAALLGYSIPVRQLETGQMMVIDQLVASPKLGRQQLRQFIRGCEQIAIQQNGIFGGLYFRGFNHWPLFASIGYVSDFPFARRAVLAVSALSDLDQIPKSRHIQLDMK